MLNKDYTDAIRANGALLRMGMKVRGRQLFPKTIVYRVFVPAGLEEALTDDLIAQFVDWSPIIPDTCIRTVTKQSVTAEGTIYTYEKTFPKYTQDFLNKEVQ